MATAISPILRFVYYLPMTAAMKTRMHADDYLAWAQAHRGAMSCAPARSWRCRRKGHAVVKHTVQTALIAGNRARGLPCHMLSGGMTIRIDADTSSRT